MNRDGVDSDLTEASSGSTPRVADLQQAPAHQVVGPYRIVGVLGRGGMGEVLLGERESGGFNQTVAIKVLRWGSVDPELQQRLLRERQILAALEHTGIARLLDGGTLPSGDPYLVLEYVRGEPITRACKQRGLDRVQRLRLFLAVCDAVQYAHQQLIVHRDIKPDNVLLTPEGQPKLLDFGIAKLLEGNDATHLTVPRAGLGMLTPAYCTPEQVRAEPVTVATDVYLLGLMLFELLTDHRAQRVGPSQTATDVERLVCEQAPPLPSRVEDQDAATARALRGDLDTIVVRALAKEPSRRYPSVAALADDVRAHLAHRPISARADSRWYRTQRFARRNAWAASAAALVLALLCGFLWREQALRGIAEDALTEARLQAQRAEQALLEAERRRGEAEAISGFVEGMLIRAGTDAGGEGPQARIVDALEPAWIEAGKLADSMPERYAVLAAVIARVHASLGQHRQAYAQLAEARQRLEGLVAERDERSLVLRRLYAEQASAIGDYAEAMSHYEWLYQHARASYGEDAAETFSVLGDLGSVAHRSGQRERVRELYDQAIAAARQRHGEHGDAILLLLQHKARFLLDSQEHAAARELLRDVVDGRVARAELDHPQLVNGLLQIAVTLQYEGLFESSIAVLGTLHEHLIRIRGPDTPARASILGNRAVLLTALQRYEPAAADLAQALQIAVADLGEDHPRVRSLHGGAISLAQQQGDYERAAELADTLVESSLRLNGESSWQYIDAQSRYWLLRAHLGDADVAAERLTALRSQASSLFGETGSFSWLAVATDARQAMAVWLSGRHQAGLVELNSALQAQLAADMRLDVDTRILIRFLRDVQLQRNDQAEAARMGALLALPDEDGEILRWLEALPLDQAAPYTANAE